MIRMMTLLVPLASLALAAAVPGAARAAAPAAAVQEDQIEVTGEGRVPVRPDIMYVRTGVELRRAQPGDAYRATGEAAARLVKVITGSGVAAADVRTTELSVRPEYGTEPPREITGYLGTESVSATIRDLGAAHRTLNAIMAAGPDVRLDGVTFDKDDVSAELAEAEKRAVADAKAKAGRAAQLAGRRLGRVLKISLSTVDAIPSHIIPKAMIAEAGGHLSPGEGVQRVTAYVTYALA